MITSPTIKDKINKDAFFVLSRNSRTGHLLTIHMFYSHAVANLFSQKRVETNLSPYCEIVSYKELRRRISKLSIIKNAQNFYL